MAYMDTLRRVLDGDYHDASEAEKMEAVQEVLQVCSVAAGATAVQPLPVLDLALLTPLQIAMVQAIGRIHGHQLDRKSIVEILSTFGASVVAQHAILAAASFVPVAGWAVKISVAYAMTWAIGEVSDFYFRSGRGVAPETMRSMFKKAYEEKKQEKQAANRGNASLKEKLEQLTEAYKAGLLTEEEFERKKEELLRAF